MDAESKTIALWVSRIQCAYASDDQTLVESLLDQAMQDTDSAPRLKELAGLIAFNRGDITDAIRLIEEAMFVAGLTISSQLTLAKAWILRGDTDAAKTTLSFLVDVIDRVPRSQLPALTHALADIKEYGLAIQACKAAFARCPNDDNAIFGVAFYMHRAGHPLQAVHSTMSQAIELSPRTPVYRMNIAIVCCALGRWEEAYRHACLVPDRALRSIPCDCMTERMHELFNRFDDVDRVKSLGLSY